jgi:hypothetical protein
MKPPGTVAVIEEPSDNTDVTRGGQGRPAHPHGANRATGGTTCSDWLTDAVVPGRV